MTEIRHIRGLVKFCFLVWVLVTGFPGGSDSKESPIMEETWIQFLGREDPMEEDMATHSSILAWRIPWTEEPGGL